MYPEPTPSNSATAAADHPAVSAADPTWAATHMAPTDFTKQALGIAIEELERGRAKASMTVRREMANGFGVTHGGAVFALADTAFAYACNEGPAPTVASGADITFTRPSYVGETLVAVATRRWQSGRNGLYDITVTNPAGEIVAEFRGRSFVTNLPLPTPSA